MGEARGREHGGTLPAAIGAAASGALEEIFDAARVAGSGGGHGDCGFTECVGQDGESHRVGAGRGEVRGGGGEAPGASSVMPA